MRILHRLKSDESLMLAYRHGDVSAFEVLYTRHKNGLFAFIHRSCPRQWVEELTQEVWMAIVDNAANYQAKAKFKTYLYQIAHNKQVDYWRRLATRKPVNVHEADAQEKAVDPQTAQLDSQYSFDQLLQNIQQLPAEQRDTFLLREQGFSQKEIAEITGVGGETVKSRLRYATDSLRRMIEVEP